MTDAGRCYFKTVRQVAKMLGVTQNTITRWCKRDGLPNVFDKTRASKRPPRMIHLTLLNEWLEDNRHIISNGGISKTAKNKIEKFMTQPIMGGGG